MNGESHGEGHYFWSNDSGIKSKFVNDYKGRWNYGKRDGNGVMNKINGDCYKGGFEGNFYSGEGFLKKDNGSWYRGRFVKGKLLEGKASEVEEKMGRVWVGHFVKGRRDGLGREKEVKSGKVWKVIYGHGQKQVIGEEKSKCVLF